MLSEVCLVKPCKIIAEVNGSTYVIKENENE